MTLHTWVSQCAAHVPSVVVATLAISSVYVLKNDAKSPVSLALSHFYLSSIDVCIRETST